MAQLDIDFSKQYLEWLKQNIEQYQIRDSIFRITLPFLDRNNDCVEVYIVDNGDGTYQITDDGATINDLEFSGFDIETSERRKKILNSIVAAYGITRLDTNELVVKCTRDDLPLKKHMLAQCMVKVSDMFYLSKNTIQSEMNTFDRIIWKRVVDTEYHISRNINASYMTVFVLYLPASFSLCVSYLSLAFR